MELHGNELNLQGLIKSRIQPEDVPEAFQCYYDFRTRGRSNVHGSTLEGN
jgi:hypothetical protein